jgi:hypothetical protein
LRFVTGARVLGVLLMVAAAGAAYWLLTNDAMSVAAPRVSGELHYTDTQQILAAAGVGDGQHPNVVKLRTDAMRGAIMSFPAIADAQVTTGLPNDVSISVVERTPILAWQRSGTDYLVDADGLVLATVDAAQVSALGLPLITDQRTQFGSDISVGGQLDPLDLAAVLQLGALTPATIGSGATSLALGVRDDDGFVLSAVPAGWQAIFGQYTPNLRPVDLIPRQVQCLRWLLGAGEQEVGTVYLAPLDERCGTYLPIATPRATPTPAPAH